MPIVCRLSSIVYLLASYSYTSTVYTAVPPPYSYSSTTAVSKYGAAVVSSYRIRMIHGVIFFYFSNGDSHHYYCCSALFAIASHKASIKKSRLATNPNTICSLSVYRSIWSVSEISKFRSAAVTKNERGFGDTKPAKYAPSERRRRKKNAVQLHIAQSTISPLTANR